MNNHSDNERNYDQDRLERHVWERQRTTGLSRRSVMRNLAGLAAGVSAFAGSPLRSYGQSAPPIVKPTPPDKFRILGTNRETLFQAFKGQGYLTPASLFFVRNHTSTPRIDADTWSLSIEGSGVARPITFTLDDLHALPSVTVTRAIECAGNGRSFFTSQQKQTVSGTAWLLGAIGVGEWTGVRLSTLLELAGVKASAVDVLPEGLDSEVGTSGHVRRPIPIGRALDDDVLVVYGLNGELLPPDHGFPARLLVPGWIGIANIKWLGRITVYEEPVFTTWNTTQYRFFGNPVDYPGDPILTTQTIKSAFELPFPATLKPGINLITGRSWSAAGTIARVDVSINNGATYTRATLKPNSNGYQAWAEWQIPWVARPGQYTLKARAVDDLGNTQPLTVPYNSMGYLFSAIAGHPVTVA
ncbi:sulfite oxidase [Aquisphaera insulae]|uniref:sulfite oxidase n=1 Tax=Aquisphaera insulae TaxID=2712864 RepID=UPI0013EDED78|nr:sulfite oxidase [Aquisphaera insulae]